MKRRDRYQIALLVMAALLIIGVFCFAYRELFPQYKIYQSAYVKLEKARADMLGEKPPPFSKGIKQIVIPDPENGPEIINRCTSCHLTTDLPHFSPTRSKRDITGEVILDEENRPILEKNPDYIFDHVDEKLRYVEVEGKKVDLAKVLVQHPLIGNETKPFENHPIDEVACTMCHSGNGRALVAKRAHGPLYDGDYEPADHGITPQFLEEDPENDPTFAKLYNAKPGHELAFQTTPLLVGPLISAKCMQCHLDQEGRKEAMTESVTRFTEEEEKGVETLKTSIERQKRAKEAGEELLERLNSEGYQKTVEWLAERLSDDTLTFREIDGYEALHTLFVSAESEESLRRELEETTKGSYDYEGALAKKERLVEEITRAQEPLKVLFAQSAVDSILGHDKLLASYERGKELFLSQACWTCHRIDGYSRSSVGPALTEIGFSYPWFVKESIVWPQADLASSTMPNFRLDHEELEDLMAYLMAQRGKPEAVSETEYVAAINEWEAGKKLWFEKPISPTDSKNVKLGMEIFATEGCASCHQLVGFTSAVQLKDDTPENREWFFHTFEEEISGEELAEEVEEYAKEIDRRIVVGTKPGQLEEIEKKHPGLLIGFYPNFKYAMRAKDTLYKDEPEKLSAYKERLWRLLMIFIQEHGLGRDIAPHLNYSGIYRDSGWLMGHFKNPQAYTAKSIMPAIGFDESKFYLLTYMLQVVGAKNRDELQELWHEEGFDAAEAYEHLCSSCHGENRQGNGLIAQWLYPAPKNLANPQFLRQLPKEEAIASITHGVIGTPMPPWGEDATGGDDPVLTESQIGQLVDWLYKGLPEVRGKVDHRKWEYEPSDVIAEMKQEQAPLEPTSLEERYFDEVEGYEGKTLYYIKPKFYTERNLEEGKSYFMANCAVCHGKEGTGSSLRASSMIEAKPRMFTNFMWMRTKDDLRLLRSIKYGVSGTSMTAWGDQTTAKQRMQLVMFIRRLVGNQIELQKLEELLFETFDANIQKVEEIRGQEFSALSEKNARYKELTLALLQESEMNPDEAGALYVEKLTLERELSVAEQNDERYKELITKLKEQKELLENVGVGILTKEFSDQVAMDYFALVRELTPQISLEEGRLVLVASGEKSDFYKKIMEAFAEKINSFTLPPLKLTELPDKEMEEQLEEQRSYINLRTKFARSVARVKEITEEWNKQK